MCDTCGEDYLVALNTIYMGMGAPPKCGSNLMHMIADGLVSIATGLTYLGYRTVSVNVTVTGNAVLRTLEKSPAWQPALEKATE